MARSASRRASMPSAGQRRHGEALGKPFRLRQVAFVQKHQPGLPLRLGQEFPFPRIRRARAVQHQQQHIGRLRRLPGARNPDGFRLALRLAQAGRVRQMYAHAVQKQAAAHRVARRAGLRGDNRARFAQQGVEQRAFADVGRAAQHDVEPLLQHAAPPRIARSAQRGRQLLRLGAQRARPSALPRFRRENPCRRRFPKAWR